MQIKPIWLAVLIFLAPVLYSAPAVAQDLQALLTEQAKEFEQPADFAPLYSEIAGRRLVLMGEATHGTSEFYHWRAELSKYLIEEKGFDFIAVEGDWPAFSRINAFVKQKPGAPDTVEEAMDAIDRWPHWMWRNREVKELIEWMRDFNSDLPMEERAGIYGVDLYAKQQAMQDVVGWFETVDTGQAEKVERLYRCLSRFSDVRNYLTRVNRTGDDCSPDVEQVLEKVRTYGDGLETGESWPYFNAEQNAKLVVNAERHFRANLERSPASWNYRARHFELTANRLLDYYGVKSKGIVWAHNTHIGDARATEMASRGMENIGQLSRERLGADLVYAIGFGTYAGEVYAARQWEGARETMEIPDARTGSWERMLGDAGPDQFFLLFSARELRETLGRPIPHRAIGVTYQPGQDGRGNYVDTVLPERYDAFIFIRETGVLDALD